MWAVQRSKVTGRFMVFRKGEYMDSFLTPREAMDFIDTQNIDDAIESWENTNSWLS